MFQRELGALFDALLHGPAESLATAWNQVVTKALDSLGGSLPGFLMVYRVVEGAEKDHQMSRTTLEQL